MHYGSMREGGVVSNQGNQGRLHRANLVELGLIEEKKKRD